MHPDPGKSQSLKRINVLVQRASKSRLARRFAAGSRQMSRSLKCKLFTRSHKISRPTIEQEQDAVGPLERARLLSLLEQAQSQIPSET